MQSNGILNDKYIKGKIMPPKLKIPCLTIDCITHLCEKKFSKMKSGYSLNLAGHLQAILMTGSRSCDPHSLPLNRERKYPYSLTV